MERAHLRAGRERGLARRTEEPYSCTVTRADAASAKLSAGYEMSSTGRGLHIVVNANAKRGGRRIAVQIARALPGASVRLTRSIGEVEGWLRTVLSGAHGA